MKGTVKFIGAIVVALVVMLAFRGLAMTVCTIDGDGLAPQFLAGDRVVVNRWSYGLRTGKKGSLFDYGRICRQDVKKGDVIAFEDSVGRVLVCRCTALPGESIGQMIVPGVVNCADQDYYWVEAISRNNGLSSRQLGFIPEDRIIGRVCLVLYSHDTAAPFWKGYRGNRMLLLK